MLISKPTDAFERAIRERLRRDILGGVLPPNSRLRIRSLSERYGVGGTPVREALSGLVPEGLISFEQNRGFRVAALSIEELLEITEMRQLIETEGFRRSMIRGDDAWEAGVLAAFHRLRKFLRTPTSRAPENRLEWEERHSSFHLALLAACGNQKLIDAAAQLYAHLARYRVVLQINDLPPLQLLELHQDILDYALDRDVERGCRALNVHFEVNVEQVRTTLASDGELFRMIEDGAKSGK